MKKIPDPINDPIHDIPDPIHKTEHTASPFVETPSLDFTHIFHSIATPHSYHYVHTISDENMSTFIAEPNIIAYLIMLWIQARIINQELRTQVIQKYPYRVDPFLGRKFRAIIFGGDTRQIEQNLYMEMVFGWRHRRPKPWDIYEETVVEDFKRGNYRWMFPTETPAKREKEPKKKKED